MATDSVRRNEPTRCANTGHKPVSFDHLVGAGEQHGRYLEPERLCGIAIDEQLDLGDLLHRQV